MSETRRILYKIAPFKIGDKVVKAKDSEIEDVDNNFASDNVEDVVIEINNKVVTLQNTAFNSGRSFIRFNDGFTIDRTNLATYEDKNIIYTAKNDKPLTGTTNPDVVLPNDTEIQASGETYPVTFEFTHLGGTQRFEDGSANVIRFFVDGAMLLPILQRDEVAIVTKPSAGEDYQIQAGSFDPGDTVLPTGVFNLKTDTPINDIATITTELAGVTIVAGDAYLVEVGGTWSGLTIPNNSILVATVNSASLLDSPTNDDWLLLDNPRVNAKSAAFLANFNQDGIVFEGSRNIKVDPANVVIFNSLATGTPITRQIGTNVQGFNRQIRYDNVPLQLADIVGGKLQLMFSIQTASSSGFEIEPLDITLHYSDSIQFVFPLSNFQIDSGNVLLEIDIPNADYSSILNTDVSLRFNYNFRGVAYDGNMTVSGLLNIAKGNLHDSIVSIADQRSQLVRAELDTKITNLIGDIDAEHQNLGAIEYRISPVRNLTIENPNISARFADDTGGAFPTAPLQLNPENPRFECAQTSCFVYTIGGGTYNIKNITQDTEVPLIDGDSIATTTIDSLTYFVHRITVAVSDILEIETVSFENVAAWQNDIDILKEDINRIDTELKHAALNLPDDVVQVLENEVTVTEETNPVIVATDYNRSFSTNDTQTVFYESNPNVVNAGLLNSKPINETTGPLLRRKLVYLPETTSYVNGNILTAFDGTTTRPIVDYLNGVFNARVFVPGVSAGSQTVTVRPAPQNRVASDWYFIALKDGNLQPESDELFLERDVPTAPTTLNINYRYDANGGHGATQTTTLVISNIGQDVSQNVTLALPDGESVSIGIDWQASQRRIRITGTPNTGSSGIFIFDMEVGISFSETRVIPAVPAGEKLVRIEGQAVAGQDNVFAIKPSATNTLIIVGDEQEVDTGYLYTLLFGATEVGYLTAHSDEAVFLDYQNFNPSATTVRDLEHNATLPQFGLFTTEYTHATIVELGTQFIVSDSGGDRYNVGDALAALGAVKL